MKFPKTANKRQCTPHRPTCLMDLPMELHFHIRDELLGDPDVEFRQLRKLRLVCRIFYYLWSPIVSSNMVLFQSGVATSIRSLRYLVHHECKKPTYKTITINDWHHLPTDMERLYCSKWQITRRIKALLRVVRTKHHMIILPKKLDLPNVRCVRLYIPHEDRWTTSRKINIVLAVTQLRELELSFSRDTDVEYVLRSLRPLSGLHKLTLINAFAHPYHIRCLSEFIPLHENLTHFNCNLNPEFPLDLSSLLRYVPIDKPLILHHVSLRGMYRNFRALLPHAQALSSFEIYSTAPNEWCAVFSQANVFPPAITVEWVDQELATYLGNHPGIISLTISARDPSERPAFQDTSLIKLILSQHTTTLQYLSLRTEVIDSVLHTIPGQKRFLKWAGNLREIVLVSSALPIHQRHNPIVREQHVFNVISRLNSSLTVVVKTLQRAIFLLCVVFCRTSTDPLVRSLDGRLVYEKWSR